MGSRKRDHPPARPTSSRAVLSVPFSTMPRECRACGRELREFRCYCGGNFSGDDGGAGRFTEIESWRGYLMTNDDISRDSTGNVVVKFWVIFLPSFNIGILCIYRELQRSRKVIKSHVCFLHPFHDPLILRNRHSDSDSRQHCGDPDEALNPIVRFARKPGTSPISWGQRRISPGRPAETSPKANRKHRARSAQSC